MENISITPDGGEVQISLRDVYYQYESTDESPPVFSFSEKSDFELLFEGRKTVTIHQQHFRESGERKAAF